MKQLTAIILLVVVASSAALSQPSSNRSRPPVGGDEEILLVLRELDGAISSGDVEAVDRLVADDYVDISDLGTVCHKKQVLELAARNKEIEKFREQLSGFLPSSKVVSNEVKVHVYENTAVVSGLLVTETDLYCPCYVQFLKHEIVTTRVRLTKVLARYGGAWRLVAAQETRAN